MTRELDVLLTGHDSSVYCALLRSFHPRTSERNPPKTTTTTTPQHSDNSQDTCKTIIQSSYNLPVLLCPALQHSSSPSLRVSHTSKTRTMTNHRHNLSVEAKSAMIANLQLELDARKEKLRAQCEAQCASLESRLERRINRIPPAKRQAILSQILAGPAAPPPRPQHTIVPAKVTKNTGQKKAAAGAKGRVATVTASTATKRTAATTTNTTTTRATRAAARTRDVLSPKTDNAKPKAAARTVKPR